MIQGRLVRKLGAVVVFIAVTANLAHAAWTVGSDHGVWWLRGPDGQRIYSRGVNSVDGGVPDLGKINRPAFHWKDHFRTANDWRRATYDALVSWGFDTRGAWSDASPDLRLPYVVELDLGRIARLLWDDPYAPDAALRTFAVARRLTAPHRHDPLLIGYFSDNEVGWWNGPLFTVYLHHGWENHTKRALWQLLLDHYQHQWEALLADWVAPVDVAGFDDLKSAGASLKLRPGGRGIDVVNRFTYLVARRYYELVGDAIRAAHPGALVLGDRLPLYYNQDAVRALRGQVDVLSTNYDADAPDGWIAPYYFDGLRRLAHVPVLVSEFFFAANENRSGNRNNGHLMTVGTQAERSVGAVAAAAGFARFPNVIGAHWFQHHDEPTGGRDDGEDFNMGLVDIAGRPYESLVDAFRSINPLLDQLHRDAKVGAGPLPDGAAASIVKARRAIALDDHSLTDWDEARTLLPGFHATDGDVPFADVHATWTPDGLYFALFGSNYLDYDLLANTGAFPSSESFQLHVAVDAGRGLRHFAIYLAPRRSQKFPDRLETEAQLYRYTGAGAAQRLSIEGRLQQIDKPLPHIALEAFMPAADLGRDHLVAGSRLRVNVTVVSYYRERGMAWAGRPDLRGAATTLRTITLEGERASPASSKTVASN